MKIAAMFSMSS